MRRIISILKGFYLYLTSNKEANALSETRYPVCQVCEYRHKGLDTCKLCGCFLPAKTRVKDEECPNGYWT